jgi:GR25 family glycosyltransferase involved in LPS biosynthesis
MKFNDVITEFVNTNNIAMYIIHLDRSVDRKPLIEQLKNALDINPIIFNAVDGDDLIKSGYPTKCLTSTETNIVYRLPGEVGCTLSHVNVCKDALKNGYEYAVIFEDDSVFINSLSKLNEELNSFKKSNIKWDMFLLDCDPTTNAEYTINYCRVKNFNNAHAYIVNRTMMEEIVRFNNDLYNKGLTCCGDGIYASLLNINNTLAAYTLNKHRKFFIQPHANYSYALKKNR